MSTGYEGSEEDKPPEGPPKIFIKRLSQWPETSTHVTTTVVVNGEACGMIRFAHQDDFVAVKKCLIAGGLWDDR